MGLYDAMMKHVTGPDADNDPRPKVLIRRYKNESDYAKDAQRMIETGYHAQGEHFKQGKANVGRTVGKAVVFLPWAILRPSRKSDSVTVTWVRD